MDTLLIFGTGFCAGAIVMDLAWRWLNRKIAALNKETH